MSTWLGSEYMSLLARIDAALLRRHQRACPWPTTSGAVTTKGATMARDERAGVASETEGGKGTELRPCDSVALTKPTGVAEAHRVAVRYWHEAMDARATLVDFQIASHKALRDAGDEIARLRAIYIERDKVIWRLRVERDDTRARLAERDAQVGRLIKRLSEGQG